jgi:hypothetical protein
MSLERLPKFDSDSFGYSDGTGSHDYHVLLCPNCKGNYLHHRKIEFEPMTYESATTGDYINIYFDCEFCGEGSDNETRLSIRQHKGQTLVEWSRKK